MIKNYKLSIIAFATLAIVCSCNGGNSKVSDTRCPELVECAENSNAKYERQKGGKDFIRVEYVDSVYRIIQRIDDDMISTYPKSLGNLRLFMYKQILSSSTRIHKLLSENNVYYELLVQSKNGEIVSSGTLTPYEITNALKGKPISWLRCPELEKKAKRHNASTEGPKGMTVKVEYVDTVYRIIQIVDEKEIPAEKLQMFYGNMKPNMIASLSAASEKERSLYQQMVEYRVTFEHVVKSKNTGELIVSTIITPDEIAEALKYTLTSYDELKTNVNTIKKSLPRQMEAGYTITDISCDDGVVTFEIQIDESMKNFDEATIIRKWPKENQAITLFDLTTGQTFYGIAAKNSVKINYHFLGSKGTKELTISFTHEEVVKYNNLMKKILESKKK